MYRAIIKEKVSGYFERSIFVFDTMKELEKFKGLDMNKDLVINAFREETKPLKYNLNSKRAKNLNKMIKILKQNGRMDTTKICRLIGIKRSTGHDLMKTIEQDFIFEIKRER